MALREVAWRVTAHEILSALQEERGTGERAATYLLSPYGARMNRVMIAGNLSAPESIGRDPAQPFWRAHLADPTGTVAVTAGGFQPRAMAQLRAGSAPRPALVVGKLHLYRGNDGTGYVSIRAEAVRTLDDEPMRTALADELAQSLDRLDLVERLMREPMVPDATLRSEGIAPVWLRAARESIRRYPSIDRPAFRGTLKQLLPVIEGRAAAPSSAPSIPPSVRVTRIEPPAPKHREAPSASERANESAFLDVMDELADGSMDGYADYRELRQRLAERGLSEDAAETILARLQDDGVVEEPIMGKLRRASALTDG
jgi:RPA family protein